MKRIEKTFNVQRSTFRLQRFGPKGLGILLALLLAAGSLLGQNEDPMLVLVRLLQQKDDPQFQLDLLRGISDGLKGQRTVRMPSGWEAVETKLASSPNHEVRFLAQTLSLTFGSARARRELRRTLNDSAAPAAPRREAMNALVGIKDPELPPLLQQLLQEPAMRGQALRALAAYDDAATPAALLKAYASLDPAQRRDALNTLVSRAAYAKPMLAAVSAGTVSLKDLTADIIRQLRTLKDPDLQAEFKRVYGTVRETSADKKAEIEKYRRVWAAGGSTPGNASAGRVVFNKVCAQCHFLFDTGGKVGPDITGANRADLNYLLETIVDPNAVIPNEYRATEVETKDGRSLTGVVKSQTDKTVALQTANELITIPRDEIASQRQSELSMMPEGLLTPLADQEVRDLLYYLSRQGQVPLPLPLNANESLR